MVFYFLITAVTIALAGLMDAVWTRPRQEAGGAVRCVGQTAESAAFGNGRRVCCSPAFGTSTTGGVSRRRAFDIVCLAAIFLILALVVFFLVKGLNKLSEVGKKKEPAAPAAPPQPTAQEKLLMEIRDLLKNK